MSHTQPAQGPELPLPTARLYRPTRLVGAVNIFMSTLHGRYTAIPPDTVIRVRYLRAVPRSNQEAETDRARGNATNQATTTPGGRVTGALARGHDQCQEGSNVTCDQAPEAPSVREGRLTLVVSSQAAHRHFPATGRPALWRLAARAIR